MMRLWIAALAVAAQVSGFEIVPVKPVKSSRRSARRVADPL